MYTTSWQWSLNVSQLYLKVLLHPCNAQTQPSSGHHLVPSKNVVKEKFKWITQLKSLSSQFTLITLHFVFFIARKHSLTVIRESGFFQFFFFKINFIPSQPYLFKFETLYPQICLPWQSSTLLLHHHSPSIQSAWKRPETFWSDKKTKKPFSLTDFRIIVFISQSLYQV